MSEDLAWLAGLLEGEGSFGVDRRGHRRIGQIRSQSDGRNAYPTIGLNMNDRDVVERAAELIRSLTGSTAKVCAKKTYPGTHTQTQWRISVSGSTAERIMQLILPYMGDRRTARISEILRERNARKVKGTQ